MEYKLMQGDSKEKLKELDDNSIDLIATDPPYGIEFMKSQISWDKALPDKEIWKECLRVLKPGASCVVMSGARQDQLWRIMADLDEVGFDLSQTGFMWVYFSGFPKGLDMSKRADKLAGEDRKVIGKNPNHREITKTDYGNGYNVVNIAKDSNGDITEPSSDLAKELDGIYSKGKIKPSWEMLIWARKPNNISDYDNQIKHGVGGINCGDCMLPTNDINVGWNGLNNDRVDSIFKIPNNVSDYDNQIKHGVGGLNCGDYMLPWVDEADKGDVNRFTQTESIFFSPENPIVGKTSGRFPANTLCTDSSLGNKSKYFDVDKWAEQNNIKEDENWFTALESGLIQIPKASKSEKNAGCEELEDKTLETSTTKTFSKKYYNGKEVKRTNNHPTVKPVRLFSYIVTLLLPNKNCTVLDPFMGSGTTGVAAIQCEQNFVGIDLDEEYIKIAEARIKNQINKGGK